MVLPAQFYLQDRLPAHKPVAIQIHGGDESIVIESRDGKVKARVGVVTDPDLTMTGPAELAVGILMGRLSAADAKKRGLKIAGDETLLNRLKRA
jgi:hypothetical protein